MKFFRLSLKSIGTALLVITFVMLAAFGLLLAPIWIALAIRGKAKVPTLVKIIPLGILALKVKKIWGVGRASDTERAYQEGIVAGQIKAAKRQGTIEGMRMIAYQEDLSLRPVYSTRAIPVKKCSQNAVPVGELFPRV